MQLRAVIFDYGMVLSGPPDASLRAELVRSIGLPEEQAEALYWKYRRAYDQGELSGLAYWRKVFSDAGQMRSSEEIALIAELDARMWTVADPVLVAWQAQLHEAGVKTAILSNMGDMVRESVERSFPWVQDFDVRLWSYELRLLKPDPEIYRIALDRLGTKAEETLFLDDVEENIEAARGVRIQSIQYKGINLLREELVRLGTSLPLPESGAR